MSRVATGAVASALTLGLVMVAHAPSAQADHSNPSRLCEKKFEGQFDNFGRAYPIYGRRGRELGHVATSFQGPVFRRGVRGWRACVVTLLKRHKRARFTSVGVRQADDRKWRSDPGRWTRYAGPVVRWAPYRGNCLIWRGMIRGGTPRVLDGYCP